MNKTHIVCVLEGSGDQIFSTKNVDYKMVKNDLFQHTVGGIATNYKVENVILDVESHIGDPEATSTWITFVQRVTVSVVS